MAGRRSSEVRARADRTTNVQICACAARQASLYLHARGERCHSLFLQRAEKTAPEMHAQLRSLLLITLNVHALLVVHTNAVLPLTAEICRYEPKEYEQLQTLEPESLPEHGIYSIEWIVGIPEGRKVADEIAKKHGFTNIGLVRY